MKTCWCGQLEHQHLEDALKIEAKLKGTSVAELKEEKARKSKKKAPVVL